MYRFVLLAPLLCGCFPGDVFYDLGTSDMSVPRDLSIVEVGARPDLVVVPDMTGFQPPPDPYMPGKPRLSIGSFYEGGASETVPVDNKTTHVYIYPAGNTLAVTDDGADKQEGYKSERLTVAGGLGWFGMGVHWDTARDLRAWQTLHISLKSESASMADVTLGMNTPMANPQTAKLSARAYGYTNDGAWHALSIPLADFARANPNPANLEQVAAPLVLVNAGAVKDGDVVKVDNVYLE